MGSFEFKKSQILENSKKQDSVFRSQQTKFDDEQLQHNYKTTKNRLQNGYMQLKKTKNDYKN